jgi:hypothetical protein
VLFSLQVWVWFTLVGLLHINEEINKTQLNQKLEIEFLPLRLFSSREDSPQHPRFSLEQADQISLLFVTQDTAQMHEFYKAHAFIDIFCEHKEGGEYLCEAFDELMEARVYQPFFAKQKLLQGYSSPAYDPRRVGSSAALMYKNFVFARINLNFYTLRRHLIVWTLPFIKGF